MSPASPQQRRPIVVGVEHSDRSLDGIALARTLGRSLDAPLLLVSVYPVDPEPAEGRMVDP